MKKYQMLLAVILTAVSAACFRGPETPRSGTVDNGVRPTAETNAEAKTAESPVKMEEIYPAEKYSQNTPTDAMRTWVMATVNKDIPALNGILSAASLQMVEKSAETQGKTVGQILTEGAVKNISKNIPEFRNEKIAGNTATVEYKDETMNEFLAMPLVKEDGKWKVAYDVFTQNLIRKLTGDMNKPVPKPRK